MITRCRPLLGTLVEITVEERAAHAIDEAFAAIAHVHERMSFHDAGSDLALLRAAPAGTIVAVDRETVAVLALARQLHSASAGLFDVAVGSALVRGRFLPDHGFGDLARFEGTTADIEIVDEGHVRCLAPMLIDLGGIAKGHAVDRAVATLAAAGVEAALVNAGGDMRLHGDRDWQVHLRDADGVVRECLTARDCAIASSANLLDRHSIGGEVHSPHIGPGGRPMLLDRRVTVIAAQCSVADAMTKVAALDPDLADAVLALRGGEVLREPALGEAA